MPGQIPNHLTSADQLGHNVVLRLGSTIGPWVLVALPFLAASHGARSGSGLWWFGGAIAFDVVAMVAAGGFVWLFRSQVARAWRRRLGEGGLCPHPHCLATLEGRRVCPLCEKELPPVCYVPGFTLARHCPACHQRLPAPGGVERCFARGCSSSLSLDGFEDRTGLLAVVVVRSGTAPDKDALKGWKERGEDRRWLYCGCARHAVLLKVLFDEEGLVSLSPIEREKIQRIWLANDSSPAVTHEVLDFPREHCPPVDFERGEVEIRSQIPFARGAVRCGVGLQEFLNDLRRPLA